MRRRSSLPILPDLLTSLLPYIGVLCLICFLSPASAFSQQEPPADAAELSRNLLYHPAQRIEFAAGAAVLRAAEFTYRFDPATSQWTVTREHNFDRTSTSRALKSWKDARRNVEYHFTGTSDEKQGELEIERVGPDGSVPVAHLVLWTLDQVAAAWLPHLQREFRGLTVEQVKKDFEPAEPEVAAVADDGTHLWLAIQHYSGEGWLGLGTLVQLDPATGEAVVRQPEELAISSITQIAVAGGTLWLGARHINEDSVEPTVTLTRFNPASGEVQIYEPGTNPIVGRIVTALAAAENFLWAATDAGICRVALPAEQWTCWRIVPTVRLVAPTVVSNRPGGAARGRLAAGSYEVRWATAAFLEVLTPDAVEGWLDPEDLDEYTQRSFEQDPYLLANVSSGGATVMRPLIKPGGDPLVAPQVFRVALERLGAPNEDGWQKVSARIGWIPRGSLAVAPVLQPISP